jgi:hypothetical protein
VICFKVSSQCSPVTAKERHKLQVIDNEVLLKVCEPERNKESEKCRMLHNKNLVIYACHLVKARRL